MMYYGPGMGGWGIAMMIIGNIILWGLLTVAAVAVVRYTGLGQPRSSSTSSPAEVSPQKTVDAAVRPRRDQRGGVHA